MRGILEQRVEMGMRHDVAGQRQCLSSGFAQLAELLIWGKMAAKVGASIAACCHARECGHLVAWVTVFRFWLCFAPAGRIHFLFNSKKKTEPKENAARPR